MKNALEGRDSSSPLVSGMNVGKMPQHASQRHTAEIWFLLFSLYPEKHFGMQIWKFHHSSLSFHHGMQWWLFSFTEGHIGLSLTSGCLPDMKWGCSYLASCSSISGPDLPTSMVVQILLHNLTSAHPPTTDIDFTICVIFFHVWSLQLYCWPSSWWNAESLSLPSMATHHPCPPCMDPAALPLLLVK